MHGGFRKLVNPATRVSEIDVEGTRQRRESINNAIRNRQDVLNEDGLAWENRLIARLYSLSEAA